MRGRFVRDWFTGELKEVFDSEGAGRTIIARETPKFPPAKKRIRESISDVNPHISKSLGVHPKQASRFNEKLRECGITDATYSNKTGFLVSTNREHRAAAWAVRGAFDQQAGSVEQKYANAIGY
jgi:hypothetical protein